MGTYQDVDGYDAFGVGVGVLEEDTLFHVNLDDSAGMALATF